MKKILLLLLIVNYASTIMAQDFRITVHNDKEEVLSHAYIHVNNRIVAVTDTLGVGYIDERNLHLGDTISVSYLATEPQVVVYDDKLKEVKRYDFILSELYASLLANEVVVAGDVEKLYRKQVNQRMPYRYQILLKVDEESKELKEATIDIVNLMDSSKTHLVIGVQTSKKDVFRMIPKQYAPSWLNYQFTYKNGTRVNISMRDIQIQFHAWSKKKFQNSQQ